MKVGARFILQAGTKKAQTKIQQIKYIIPPENPNNTKSSSSLKLNDIARVQLKLSHPIFLDTYEENKKNGAFILINPQTNNTAAVGFVV